LARVQKERSFAAQPVALANEDLADAQVVSQRESRTDFSGAIHLLGVVTPVIENNEDIYIRIWLRLAAGTRAVQVNAFEPVAVEPLRFSIELRKKSGCFFAVGHVCDETTKA
jgi:hypothetical protein